MNSSLLDADNHEQGFALLEVVVALVIMALVGLMAWRGMDAMIRGREIIDRRANQDAGYSQLVRQFERDCQEILRRDEIGALFAGSGSSASSGTGSAGNTSAIASLAAGAKNIWWVRRYRADNQDAWMIVGYGMSPSGLQRLTSRPLLRKSEVGALWASISRDPDLSSSELLVSLEIPSVVKQSFQVQTSVISGSGGTGISASGTAAPSTASGAASNSGTGNTAISNIYPDQQGVVMQWWIKDIPLPITRSCLMGGAL
ncbi:prepilin-type N-terminal cleavage/methylation domain-containing protein [Polynucleobacter sp. 71A-WALBACH]|uniref:PulJ/GspJ family protein n=1 Tax=Polynucleobacter sp. 71A-WALBACH TaxID=2689097 RepID=UPI001C0AF082|nr:prepilin-type N-terminal cleavage/methylation domain-containing protein [Polynucleobacter sp. 71A-WALBACH]MBU3593314.1 prepilin-type N-terminal cleavage/methylation domain-containing protein [Polynucleobacter sp. 71A-WALBACH]